MKKKKELRSIVKERRNKKVSRKLQDNNILRFERSSRIFF